VAPYLIAPEGQAFGGRLMKHLSGETLSAHSVAFTPAKCIATNHKKDVPELIALTPTEMPDMARTNHPDDCNIAATIELSHHFAASGYTIIGCYDMI
jgi:hypothetical protein